MRRPVCWLSRSCDPPKTRLHACSRGLRWGSPGACCSSHAPISPTFSLRELPHGLVVAEVAIALILLSGAGFFIRGLDRLVANDHGWRTDRLLTANLTLSPIKYPEGPAQLAFYERVQTRLAALPGVERAALA